MPTKAPMAFTLWIDIKIFYRTCLHHSAAMGKAWGQQRVSCQPEEREGVEIYLICCEWEPGSEKPGLEKPGFAKPRSEKRQSRILKAAALLQKPHLSPGPTLRFPAL